MTAAPSFAISTELIVRFSDLDPMGHLNNARLVSFLEEGRVHYFQALLPPTGEPADPRASFPFILASLKIDYRAPAYLGETLRVALGVTRFGRASFDMGYRVTAEKRQQLVAEASTTLVYYDYAQGKPRSLPEELKARIAALEAGPTA